MTDKLAMFRQGRRLRRPVLAAVLVLAAGLGACESYKPKDYTSNDRCQDCPPGMFSGDDGVVTLEL